MSGTFGTESAWLRFARNWASVRKPASVLESVLLGALFVVLVFAAWWFITRGPVPDRIVGPLTLPSPAETFKKLPQLWGSFETPESTRETLLVNTLVTLRRVALGFSLALIVGVPLGVLVGCFPRFAAFLAPGVMFGRNIPLAAVLPLMLFIFGTGEKNKVMFIFVASVAFVISDSARAVSDVASRYIDTAYTLGASRWQTIIKVLAPLALPTIFSPARVMFGLAFGYIMLAESIRGGDEVGGLGNRIQIFQRRGFREDIYLILIIIPLVAFFVDRMLFWIQRELFPHVYGGDGYLHRAARGVLQLWDDAKRYVFGSAHPPGQVAAAAEKKPATSAP